MLLVLTLNISLSVVGSIRTIIIAIWSRNYARGGDFCKWCFFWTSCMARIYLDKLSKAKALNGWGMPHLSLVLFSWILNPSSPYGKFTNLSLSPFIVLLSKNVAVVKSVGFCMKMALSYRMSTVKAQKVQILSRLSCQCAFCLIWMSHI